MSIKSSIRTITTLGKGLATGLPEAAEDRDPIELFQEWLAAAQDAGILLHDATALATSTPDGTPSVRMVLLKAVDERGFVFYTNYESRKAKELDDNPRAALCIHWPVLQRQVRISGTVERTSQEESAEYFATRPRGSQLGAWASRQSDALEDRGFLEGQFRRYREQFGEGDVPLPDFWGGYRLLADRIEFWQGRADRLHDRLLFTREGEGWRTERLQP